LRAALDWSYELLSETERVILHRLGIFAGLFRLEAASSVAGYAEISLPEVIEGVANLTAKSLVVTELEGQVARYRLLDTTRAYVLEKLRESGEFEAVARRHAQYYRDLFEQAEADWQTRPAVEWLADYGHHIDNLREALDWAFSPNGDAEIGIALMAAAVPLWMHLSLIDECRDRIEKALAALGNGANPDPRREMKLQVALGTALMNTRSAVIPDIAAAWTKALEASREPWRYRLPVALALGSVDV
jgi:predicted ATPase